MIAQLHRDKADRHYRNQRSEEAVREYTDTIGFLEPSYVIKQFLDPQHAHFLIDYLEALQAKQGISARESAKRLQTTLLFNCSTELRRTDAIRATIDKTIAAGAELFDVETAVEVLSRDGYGEDAGRLAQAFGKHESDLQLLLEGGEYAVIADYLPRIPPAAVLKYGPVLLDHLPDARKREFAVFVVRLATPDPTQFRTVFALDQAVYFFFLKELARAAPQKLSQFLWDDFVACAVAQSPRDLPAIVSNPAAAYSSEQALIVLREAWNIRSAEASPTPQQLQDLAQLRVALRVLSDKCRMYGEILEIAETHELVAICETYAAQTPSVWRESLKRAIDKKNIPVAKELVSLIIARDILPFNAVLAIIAKAPNCQYDAVREFAVTALQRLAADVREREVGLDEIDAELVRTHRRIDALANDYFAVKPAACKGCTTGIDLPARHFRCGHNFTWTMARTGAASPADLNNVNTISVFQQAVASHNAANGTNLAYVNIESATKQVVSGFNFKGVLNVTNNGVAEKYDVTVWQKAGVIVLRSVPRSGRIVLLRRPAIPACA
jgi:hypothetical protein